MFFSSKYFVKMFNATFLVFSAFLPSRGFCNSLLVTVARGHGLLSSRLFFMYFVFLTVWLLEFTNSSFNATEIAETFPENRINKLISGRKYGALGFHSSRRKKYFATRTNYYPNSSSGFQQSRLILLSGDVEENPGVVNETRATVTRRTLTSR